MKKDQQRRFFLRPSGMQKKAGEHVLHCVKSVGVNEETKVHCVGDGAVWIANQIEEQFGANGTYLIDFCHLCDYLSAAAPSCSPNNEKIWLDKQKELLKESLWPQVLLVLQPYLESQEVPEENAPVRACYRYIKNRPHQLDYKDAIDIAPPHSPCLSFLSPENIAFGK